MIDDSRQAGADVSFDSSSQVDDVLAVPHSVEGVGDVFGLARNDVFRGRPLKDSLVRRPNSDCDFIPKLCLKIDLTREDGKYEQVTETYGETFCVWGHIDPSKVF